MTTRPPRIPVDEIDEVVGRAAELQAEAHRPPSGADVSEVKRAAREAGIDPSFVDRALAERARRAVPSGARWLLAALLLAGGAIAGLSVLAWTWMRTAPATGENASVAAPAEPAPPPTEPAASPTPSAGPEATAGTEASAGTAEPASAAPPEPTPVAEPRAVTSAEPTDGPLVPRLLAGAEATQAAAAVVGDWQLFSYVSLGDERVEVPVRRRAVTEPPAEAWEFLPSGRYRHSLGGDMVFGGRWSVAGSVSAPARLAWLSLDTWWLVALDDVTASYDPLTARGREWALVARDGDEALIVYLHTAADATEITMGGRFEAR